MAEETRPSLHLEYIDSWRHISTMVIKHARGGGEEYKTTERNIPSLRRVDNTRFARVNLDADD